MKRNSPFNLLTVMAAFAIIGVSTVRSSAAEIAGQITNGTTDQPVIRQRVELISHQSGMEKVGAATTDGTGHYVINEIRIHPKEFYLLKTTYRGVEYNAPVKLDPSANASMDLTVYEATSRKPDLRVSKAQVVVRVRGSQAQVEELFALRNPLNKAYGNPQGTFFFHVPAAVGVPAVAAVGLMHTPLPQNLEKGKSPGDFRISYPLKPGRNVLAVDYNTNYTDHLSLAGSVPYPIAHIQLFVIPSNLDVKSTLFTPAGQDSRLGAQILEANNLKAGTALAAEFTGQPALATEQSSTDQAQEQVKIVPDSITSAGIPFLLVFLLILLWALGVRATKEWPRWKALQAGRPMRKQAQGTMRSLINSIADIDELYAGGKIAEKQYWKERHELKAKAVAILKAGPPRKSKLYAASGPHR